MSRPVDDGVNEITEMWRDIHKQKAEKRGENRVNSAQILKERGINFESKNGGAHLIVSHNGKTVDFWPGTGKWISRIGGKGRGVRKLLKMLEAK